MAVIPPSVKLFLGTICSDAKKFSSASGRARLGVLGDGMFGVGLITLVRPPARGGEVPTILHGVEPECVLDPELVIALMVFHRRGNSSCKLPRCLILW